MKKKKLIILLAIVMISGLGFINSVYAVPEINTAYMYTIGDCGKLLNYKGAVVLTDYVQYDNNGVSYPAYCLDKTKVRSTSRTL